ncbi:FecR domain-containing protein [Microbulbifer spongiae]|uniref:FecR domain-containing protein n=1 Tax=Microbulbifer spongiae TaxID=2944933 RepID=A0ABY9EDR4_9GAMM|nr:FecR domain-containing protein [Microbulbifer sp. MI-G]WKD49490.1 FecR domain-containing protein [Microbulbifer sp. MI-G]
MKPKGLSTETIRQASDWMARLWADEVTESERRAFQHWLGQHQDNQKAWRQLQQLQEKFKQLPDPEAGRAVLMPTAQRNRRLLLWAGLSLGVTALLGSGTGTQHPSDTQVYFTDTGQIKPVTLPDGTQLVLNTNTRVYARTDRHRRQLYLGEGEVMITTAAGSRPFLVVSREGRIRPLGTRFTVRQLNKQTQVCVYEGRVALRLAQAAGVREVDAGHSAVFSANAVLVAAQNGDHAWTQRRLVATRMPLPQFARELSRYRKGFIRVHPQLQGLVVTGVFSLENTDQALHNLSQVLPLKVRYLTPYWVSLTPS